MGVIVAAVPKVMISMEGCCHMHDARDGGKGDPNCVHVLLKNKEQQSSVRSDMDAVFAAYVPSLC